VRRGGWRHSRNLQDGRRKGKAEALRKEKGGHEEGKRKRGRRKMEGR
jgi:hypothetical protein